MSATVVGPPSIQTQTDYLSKKKKKRDGLSCSCSVVCFMAQCNVILLANLRTHLYHQARVIIGSLVLGLKFNRLVLFG
jgi:hypothetical protein